MVMGMADMEMGQADIEMSVAVLQCVDNECVPVILYFFIMQKLMDVLLLVMRIEILLF